MIASADYRWTGAARRVAAGTSLEEFVAANAQDQCEGAVWDVTEIDGRHALRRAGCGRVDLDVMVGSDVYSFSLAGTGPYESVLLFGRIAATIQLPEPFASTVNDYTLKMPPAWDVERATAPGVPDTFVGPRHLRMTMAMHRASTTTDVVERAATLFPRRSTGSDQYCVGRSSTPPVKDRQFRGSEIDGFPAAVRSSCGFVDATILVRDRIYELSLASPHVASGGDDAAFAMLASRIDVGTAGGGSPVWSQTFRSKLHGYVMHYPKAWRVSPASTARANDVFGTDSSRTRLSITVRPKPRGDQLDLYADGLLPHHAKGDGCHWSSTGIIFIPAGPAPFKAAAIAGRPAVVRSECDFIEAVIDVGDHALVLSMHSGKRLPDADRPTFDMFTAALEVMASAT